MKRILMLAVMCGTTSLMAKTLYVWSEGANTTPFGSWANAAHTLQAAVDAAVAGDVILVAPGTYTAAEPAEAVVEIGAHLFPTTASTFTLRAATPPGVSPGRPVIDGQGSRRGILASMSAASNARTLLIDGFAIINGAAASGGAIYVVDDNTVNAHTHLSIVNCIMTNNSVTGSGGAISGGNFGWPFSLTVRDSRFEDNQAGSSGGAFFIRTQNTGGNPQILFANSAFVNNSAGSNGGAIYFSRLQRDAHLRVENVLFANNTAGTGSAFHNLGQSNGNDIKTFEFVNTTFAGNQSTSSGGVLHIAHGGDTTAFTGVNLVFAANDNADSLGRNITGTTTATPYTIEYSRIDDADTNRFPAVSNLLLDPQFVNPDGGNYRLRGSSPCINAGVYQSWMDEAVDLDGNPRLDAVYGQVDMGCYEFQYRGTTILVQ